MELNINSISVAHRKDVVVKIFDDPDECIKFANKFEKKYHIKLSCDPLYAFLVHIETKGYMEGHKDGRHFCE